jgi:hypothetical protein
VDQGNTAVRTMIRQLQNAFNETLDALYDLPEDYLHEGCGHTCARGGSARDLVVHNIFHESSTPGRCGISATNCVCCRVGEMRICTPSWSTTTWHVHS